MSSARTLCELNSSVKFHEYLLKNVGDTARTHYAVLHISPWIVTLIGADTKMLQTD